MEKEGIIFLGDTFLRTRNGENPFKFISEHFGSDDICLNLEASLTGGKPKIKAVNLSIKEEELIFLNKNMNFINLVNNHSGDSSSPETLSRILISKGKTVIGPLNPSKSQILFNDKRIDLFGCYLKLSLLNFGYSESLIKKLMSLINKSNADRKIVMLHWGFEHLTIPAPFQKKLAYKIANAGADLIIGHHPHMVQGFEQYKSTKIFYSLGNFNFWQFDKQTSFLNKLGLIVKYIPDTNEHKLTFIKINDNFQPEVYKNDEHFNPDVYFNELSEMSRIVNEKGWFNIHYKRWYISEFNVWKLNIINSKNFKRAFLTSLKFLGWLLLPIQLKFYYLLISKNK